MAAYAHLRHPDHRRRQFRFGDCRACIGRSEPHGRVDRSGSRLSGPVAHAVRSRQQSQQFLPRSRLGAARTNRPAVAALRSRAAAWSGGSSAVNTTIALRGVPEDYDEWASLGNPAWAWDRVLPCVQTSGTRSRLSAMRRFTAMPGRFRSAAIRTQELLPQHACVSRIGARARLSGLSRRQRSVGGRRGSAADEQAGSVARVVRASAISRRRARGRI